MFKFKIVGSVLTTMFMMWYLKFNSEKEIKVIEVVESAEGVENNIKEEGKL